MSSINTARCFSNHEDRDPRTKNGKTRTLVSLDARLKDAADQCAIARQPPTLPPKIFEGFKILRSVQVIFTQGTGHLLQHVESFLV